MTATAPGLPQDAADPRRRRARAGWIAALLLLWAASRLVWQRVYGVEFDASTLRWYLQFLDPELLRHRLLESAFSMRDQPPGFNLLLGAVLKLAGRYGDLAFQALWAAMGAALVATLWSLMLRLRVEPGVAFVVTALFATSPVTALYESWLFYTYPVTLLLCLSAHALHRFAASGRSRDAALFFALAGGLVFVRGTFHFAWFVVVVAGCVLLIRSAAPRRILLAAAVPCVLLLSLYVKNYLTFGDWFAGRVYRDMNYARMVLQNVSEEEKSRLVAEGVTTAIVHVPIYQQDLRFFRPFLDPVEPTGIAVLDREVKSTGHPSWQSLTMQQIGARMRTAAEAVARRHPDALWRSVAGNARSYFLPADQTYPFLFGERRPNYGDPNALALAGPLELRRRLVGQREIGGVAWAYVIGLPAVVLCGLARLRRWLRGGEATRPEAVALAFMLFTIAYLAAVTILLSHGDHSRYRFEVAPFYAVLAGLLATSALRWALRRGRARRPEATPP